MRERIQEEATKKLFEYIGYAILAAILGGYLTQNAGVFLLLLIFGPLVAAIARLIETYTKISKYAKVKKELEEIRS